MAKVIFSPTVPMGSRRKLSVGAFPASVSSNKLPDQDKIPKEVSPGVKDTQEVAKPEAVNIEKLMAERDTALDRAKSAEAQLAKMREQLENERQKANDIGYKEGFQLASEKVAAEYAEKIEALKALLKSLPDEQIKLVQTAEDAAVEIGFTAAAKIIGRMSVDPVLLEAMVKEAMNKVCDREGLVVYLAAADCRRMEKLKAQDNNANQWSRIEFKIDEQVGLGGCIIRSRVGFLDARLEYQINELKKVLIAAHASKTEKDRS